MSATIATLSPFYKLIHKTMKNRDYTYKEGLNTFTKDYDAAECKGAGLYFTDLEDIPYWVARLSFAPDCLVFKVEIPRSAKAVQNRVVRKWKTNAIILSDPMPILAFLASHNMEDSMVSSMPSWISFIPQTEVRCIDAVKRDCTTLLLVKHQTEDICLAAVQSDPRLLAEVKEQTPKICLAAVKKYGPALAFVNDKSYEVCLAAVKQCGQALELVNLSTFTPQQAYEIAMVAVRNTGAALKYCRADLVGGRREYLGVCAEALSVLPQCAINYVDDEEALFAVVAL